MLNKKKFTPIMICSFLVAIIVWGISITSQASTTGEICLTPTKNQVEKAEEIEIGIHIQNTKTAAFMSVLHFDDTKVEYVSGPGNVNVIDNRIIYVWHDTNGGEQAKEGELGKFIFQAKEDGLANFIIEGEFYSPKGQLIQTNFKETQVQIGKEESILELQANEEQGTDTQSHNAYLQAFRIDLEGVTPNFDKNIDVYDVTVSKDITEIEVLAIAENPNATIEIKGNKGLKEGLNTITIHVQSPDKTQTKTYTIQVTKTANPAEANTNLEVLAIENALLEPPFSNDETHYTTQVANDVTNLKLLAVPENEKASVQIVGKDEIKEGDNKVIIVVTAENGFTKRQYEILVYKRNEQEEKQYQEEQSNMQEKLEHAYEIEQTSVTTQGQSAGGQENTDDTSKNNGTWIVGGIILIAGIVAGFAYQKRKKTMGKSKK